MPGNNNGNQLNVLVFEVGYVIDDEALRAIGRDVRTVCLHTMEVVPETIATSNPSRSSVSQTMTSAVLVKGGVGLRTWSMQGNFGVRARAGGTGPARYERFVREVVRLSEALTQSDVDAAKNVLLQSPGLGLALREYDEQRCYFFVNFYNFWDGIACHATVPSFQATRGYRNAGATGNVSYSITVQEVGPLIRSGLGANLLEPLFNVLTTWDDVNEALKSARLSALVDTLTGPTLALGNLLIESIDALLAVVDDVQSLLGAGSSSMADTSSGGTWVESANNIVRYGEQLSALLEGISVADSSAGAMDPSTATEVERLGAEMVRALNLAGLGQAADAARFNLSVGRLYGIDDETLQAMVVAGGPDYYPAPKVGATRAYVVEEFDTVGRIEAATGVDFATIQAVNNMSPRECLIPGTELRIPVLRARGPQGSNGLPIFGSHLGEGAYGVDLHVELLDDGASPLTDLLTVSGEANLRQAVTTITTEAATGLAKELDVVPDAARGRFIARKMEAAILGDRRFTSVTSEATLDASGNGYDVVNTVTTVSDGTLEVGQENVYGE